jgi:hypothetical protein
MSEVTTGDLLEIITHQQDRIEELTRLVHGLLPENMLPFHERLPDRPHITKVHADLFHNPTARQGAAKYDLKVFVWLDTGGGKNGSIRPLHFHMHFADRLDISSHADDLLSSLWCKVNSDPTVMIGCIVHQGAHVKPKGKLKLRDQVALVLGDELLLVTPEFNITLGTPDAPKKERKAKAPIKAWTWQP